MNTQNLLKLSAAGLVLGPLCFTTGDVLRRVVDRDAPTGPVALADAAAAHPGLWSGAFLLSLLATVFFLPGVVGLVITARGRGSTTTAVGGTLLGLGLLASVGHAVAFYGPFALYDRAGLSPAAVRDLDRASEHQPVLVALILVFMVGLMLGTLVLLVGLRLAGLAPVWAVVAGLLFVVLGGSGGVVAGLAGVVAALLAFAPVAVSLLRGPSSAARKAPEIEWDTSLPQT